MNRASAPRSDCRPRGRTAMRCARPAGGRRADHGAAAWCLSCRGPGPRSVVGRPGRHPREARQYRAAVPRVGRRPTSGAIPQSCSHTQHRTHDRGPIQDAEPSRQDRKVLERQESLPEVAAAMASFGRHWPQNPRPRSSLSRRPDPTSDRTADRCALTRAQALLSLGSRSAAHSGNPSSSRAALRPDFASSRTASSAYTQNGPRQ